MLSSKKELLTLEFFAYLNAEMISSIDFSTVSRSTELVLPIETPTGYKNFLPFNLCSVSLIPKFLNPYLPEEI